MPTPPGGDSGQTRPQSPGGFSPSDGTAAGSPVQTWLLLGASALVLAAGILVAVKKKY